MTVTNKILVSITLAITVTLSSAQHKTPITIPCKLEKVVKLPKAALEISGMIYRNDGFWIHNDSGNAPFIMFMKKDGTIESIKEITRSPNYDWEDITSDKKGNIYIGDIGNNRNTRRTLQIYKIPDPTSLSSMRVPAEKIEFSYNDQMQYPPKGNRLVYDAEAMIYFNDTIFIFNKNRTKPFDGFVRLHSVPARPGNYKAILRDSIYLGGQAMETSWITGADISRDGKTLALLSHQNVWLFTDFVGDDFFKGKLSVMNLKHFSQKEAICFDDEGEIFIADELFENVLGGNLYRLTQE